MRRALAIAFVSTLVPAAAAQGELLTFEGPGSSAAPIARFGLALDGGGDVDGDGRADVLVGDPARRANLPEPSAGAVDVLSGSDGSLLFRFTDGPLLESLGGRVANAGDVDNDGVNDAIMTASEFGAGTVQVVSGATGDVLHLLRNLGNAVGGVGDVDGDGHSEFVVGSPSGGGRVQVVSGATGLPVWSIDGSPAERLGSDVDGGADIDGDGTPDVLVASRPFGEQVRARVYSGADGTPIHDVPGFDPAGSYGVRVAFVGMLDADGVVDFALTEPQRDVFSVFSGADASLLFRGFGDYASFLGADITGVDDVNGDGHGDVLVGAPRAGFFGFEGQYRVYSGIDGALLHVENFGSDGERGSSVAPAGDQDGDGIGDYAIGVPYAGNGSGGQVQIFSSATHTLIRSFESPYGGFLGMSTRSMGDVDGDGQPELVAGNPEAAYGGSLAGRVSILSPATGDERHFDGRPSRGMGDAVAFVGDVDDDGHDDIAIGLTNSAQDGVIDGAVEVRSGLDGSLLHELRGERHGAHFGDAVAGVGDLNGDGHGDVAVGATLMPDATGTATGAVRVHSGLDGSLLFERLGTLSLERYGTSVDGGEDLNGDLVPDVLVGAPFARSWGGVVEVLSGVDGAVLRTVTGEPNQRLGMRVRWIGDVTGDAVPDFAVGGRADPPGIASLIQVRSGADGETVYEVESPLLQFYEATFDGVGDLSGDGVPELAVGFPDEDRGGERSGEVTVFSGSDGRFLARWIGSGAGATFGAELAAGGDVNGDGVPDLVASSPEENAVGTVRAFDGTCLRATAYCTVNPHSGGIPARIQAEGLTSVSHNDFKVVAVDGPPGKFCVFFYGPTAIDTPFGDGRRCVGGAVKRLQPARQFDGTGRLERSLDFGLPPLAAGSGQVVAGSTWNFQGWFRDPAGPGGSGFNLTDGLRVTFCP